jgi:hypothetical protein
MSNKEKQTEKLVISLRENGLHSLWRGIESYGAYDKNQDKLMLKDAIMFLHHGVELLMKEILNKYSLFLIFEDLSKAATRQEEANNQGVGIFYLENPPKTVTYEEAIKRVSAFIKPPELTKDLQKNLATLNQFRNQLEHYAIDVDKEKIVQLLAALQEPILELFDKQIGGVRKDQPAKVSQVWNEVQNSAKFYRDLEKEAFDLITHFKGQRVPGRLFSMEGEFTLPTFINILQNQRISSMHGTSREVDILGEGPDFRWVIEIKSKSRVVQSVIDQVLYSSQTLNAIPWLIIFGELPENVRKLAQVSGVMITGIKEWEELKTLIIGEKQKQ